MSQYTVQQAAEHAAVWCKRHPAWMRFCDLPNGWYDQQQKKPPEVFITGAGEVVPRIADVPLWPQSDDGH